MNYLGQTHIYSLDIIATDSLKRWQLCLNKQLDQRLVSAGFISL